jgi:uncharacterized protein YccT (UPF0319 family)
VISSFLQKSLCFCLLSSTFSTFVLTTPTIKITQAQTTRESNTISAANSQTNLIVQEIAKLEVERALSLAQFTIQNPIIVQFDVKLQNLRKQLPQTQTTKRLVKKAVVNGANKKIQALKIERAQNLTIFTQSNPIIGALETQTDELKALIRRYK